MDQILGPWLVRALAVAAVLFLLDRLALWAEARGYLYWRHRRPSSSAVGNAMLSVHALLEPEKTHVVQARLEEREEEGDAGDPPDAPRPTG